MTSVGIIKIRNIMDNKTHKPLIYKGFGAIFRAAFFPIDPLKLPHFFRLDKYGR